LACYTDEGIFGWLVAVGRRVQRRPRQVRVVVGAAGGEADPAHVERLQQAQQLAPTVADIQELLDRAERTTKAS